MRFFLNFLNLCYLTLQRPGELPVALEDSGPREILPHLAGVAILTGLSSSVAVYYLRDFYDSAWFLQIFLLAFLSAALTILWGVLFGALLDAIVRIRFRERAGKPWMAAALLIFSALPNVFAVAGAVIGGFLPTPAWIVVPVQLSLLVWSVLIAVIAVQYLYELNLRAAILAYAASLLPTAAFPGLVFIFLSLRLIEMVL